MEINEKFEALSPEKKMRIINAGLECFGKYGYQKANTDEIAVKAGISKGLLFYYFKNKETYYFYLFEYCNQVFVNMTDTVEMNQITDFFEMLHFGIRTKLKLMKKYPYIYDFILQSVLSEDDKVGDTINKYVTDAYEDTFHTYFKNIDFSYFKEEADPKYIYQMFTWLSEGYMAESKRLNRPFVFEEVISEFEIWVDMLKKLSYKEEYL